MKSKVIEMHLEVRLSKERGVKEGFWEGESLESVREGAGSTRG